MDKPNVIKYYNAGSVIRAMEGTVTVSEPGKSEQEFVLTDDVKQELATVLQNKRMNIVSISIQDGKLGLTVQKDRTVPNDLEAEWAREHRDRTGVEPGFF